jgi:hypothetical protein
VVSWLGAGDLARWSEIPGKRMECADLNLRANFAMSWRRTRTHSSALCGVYWAGAYFLKASLSDVMCGCVMAMLEDQDKLRSNNDGLVRKS